MKAIMVLVGALVLTSALASPAQADDVRLYFDKAKFIADTGASSATGPLPDVGIILDADVDPPVSSYTLGSITLGLTLGSDNVFMGTGGIPGFPDWYPGTPGHDLAFGWERFQVSTTGPVYSFGFDIVEPDVTMPSFGGTPEESTYEFLLFNGNLHVGTVLFDGKKIPNDVRDVHRRLERQAVRPRRHQRPQRQRRRRIPRRVLHGHDAGRLHGESRPVVHGWNAHDELRARHGGAADVDRLVCLWRASSNAKLLSVPLPALTPSVSFPIAFPLPSMGEVGVLSTLATAGEGLACSAYKTVSTTP